MLGWTEGQVPGSAIARVVPDVICDVIQRGWCLAEAIGYDGDAGPELTRFVEERRGRLAEQ